MWLTRLRRGPSDSQRAISTNNYRNGFSHAHVTYRARWDPQMTSLARPSKSGPHRPLRASDGPFAMCDTYDVAEKANIWKTICMASA